MMKEKYESLALSVLRDLAKARGLRKISTLRKPELVKVMCEADERDKEEAERKAAAAENGEEPEQDDKKEPVVYSLSAGAEYVPSNAQPQPPLTQSQPPQQPHVSERTGNYRNSHYNPTERRPYRSYQENRYPSRYSRDNNDNNRSSYQRPSQTGMDNRMQQPRENNYANDEQRRIDEQNAAAREVQDVQQDATTSAQNTLDSGNTVSGILEVMPDGFGFIRSDNYMPGENDVYVSPSQIRRFNLKTGDIVTGNTRVKTEKEKFSALLYVSQVNGMSPSEAQQRKSFEQLTPIFPNERIHLECPGCSVSMRIMDLVSPIGKGQRGMIVSQPKAGKTTLLKGVAKSILTNNPDMTLIILLIDERPEEVTDIREAIQGDNVEVIYSTFDELPEHHKRVSEMVIERAKRLVEHKKDVIILLDSITRLARAYNLTVPPSGRTLSGGLDPAALHMPKRFFGAARNMREGGSLTILATALVETGSKMDDVVYEEFKGTGNMELVLDRKLSERRIFPAIDIVKSGTRREDLLLAEDELQGMENVRRAVNGMRSDEAVENILNMFTHTRTNQDFINIVQKNRIV